ncbi:MAG: T9SS type A sorting domain-containing protein [Bacteroidia bacterium]
MSFSPGYTYTLEAGQTQTVGNLCATGTGALPIRIQSSNVGTQATISKASGTMCWDYVRISDLNGTGGATFDAGLAPSHTEDLGGNSGFVFAGTCTPVSCTPCNPPVVTTQPANSTICAGSNSSFTVAATGDGIAYQWQVNAGSGYNNLSNIAPYSGATTNTLQITAATSALNGYQYRCIVNGTCTPSATSNGASLTVNPAPSVTVNSVTICAGQTATLIAAGATTYSWNTGATTNTISASPGATTSYTVTGTSNGCSANAVATITVNPLPTVNVNSATIVAGQNATLTATGATSYVWSTGAITNSITVSPTATTSYTVTGTNSGCSTTAIAIVTVDSDTTSEEENEPDINALMSEPGANFYDIQTKMLAYFEEHPDDSTETDGPRAKYNRWEWFWRDRVDDPITHSKSGGFNAVYKALAAFNEDPAICNTPVNIVSNWTGLGPFSQPNPTGNQNMGIIPSLYVDPFNNNNIFAGSNTSGMFKTTNGGTTWNNPDVSRLPAMGIKSIVVDPASNNQTIYVATGMAAMWRPGYGLGILKSTDGGANWNQTVLSMTPTSSEFGDFNVYKILRDPNNTPNNTNIYYAITDHKVYKTTDGFNSTLIDITPAGADHFRDIQFRASFSNILFVVGDNKLYWTSNTGNSWTNVTSNLSIQTNINRMAISTISDAVFVFYGTGAYPNFQPKIDKYSFTSGTWSNVSSPACSGSCGPFNRQFDHNSILVVSPVDPQIMYLGQGQNVLLKSVNGGATFFAITQYNGTEHADIRNVQLMQATAGGTGDKLFIGNDGGVSKTTNGGTSWTNINGTGLNVTQFYGIGSSEKNPNLIAGGTQDNGFYIRNLSNWNVYVPGDAYDVAIDKQNPSIMFGTANGGYNSLYKKTTTANNLTTQIIQPPGASLPNRPIFVDNNNNWYVGHHNVFVSFNQGNTSWIDGVNGRQLSNFDSFNTTAILQDGTVYNSVPPTAGLVALAVAPSNSNIIYAAYPGPTWDVNPANGLSCGGCPQALSKKLFLTTDGGTSWSDITAGLEAVRYAGITRIAVDPNNPYRVWLTFNDIWESAPGQGVNRVVFGEIVNGNWIWTDYSKKLPGFPVLSIVYQEGTDDALYIGTDVGVYYTNPTLYEDEGWVCFSNQLPVIIVPDLEINYCSGKLRAATHGRGIWESPLAPSPPKTLSTGTIAAPVSYASDVRIPSGVTVTLTSTMSMAAGKKIIVERGGNLTVNGGTITNGCGLMWQGIEVQGNRNASQQTAGAQGKVILKNNALIENAREGITTIKTNANGTWDWNYTGGIVQAHTTTFRNCRRDAQFLSYRNFHPVSGATLNNIGYFRNCVFETTQQLNDPAVNLEAHVTLYDVKGIQFLGNDFSNTAPTGANLGVIQNGITSIDAAYTVADLCLSGITLPCTTVKRSSFKNLKYGIYATNSNPLLKVTVNHAIFVNNRYDGIYLKGMNYPIVINSSFDVGSYTQLSSGLYLDNCKYYSVQNNQFFTTSTGGGSVGIWANNSKAGAHEIYNNTFTGLSAGIVPLNDNSGMSNTTDGLRMNCNTFIGNNYDIGITGSTANNNSIALVQGSTPGTSKDLVRNRYSAPCGSENQFFITGSTKPVIHASNTNANTKPLPQPSCSDALVQVSSTSYQWQASDCPDKTLSTNQQLIAQISQLAIAAQALRNNYNATVDGGNTQQLITTVNSNISAGNLKNTLMNKSPYLSDPVMVAYLTRPSTPPPGHIKDVVTANSPVTTTVKAKVDVLNLPNGIQQQINNAQTGVSARLKLEAQIAHAEFNAQLYTADIINSFLNDTLIASPIDSVIKTLTVFPRPDASKELVQAYITKGDYTSALSLINSQPVTDFGELQKLIIQVNQATDKAYSLQTNTTLKANLEAFANNCNREGCAYAQALLNLVFNTPYPELRILPQGLREMQVDISSEQAIESASGLLIYPNPANDEVNIVFNDTTVTTAIVEIHDLLGRLIEHVSLKPGIPFKYDTKLLQKSVYMVSLYINGELVENKKLVLIK